MLRPTAKNKMYRAELVSTNLGGRFRQSTVATSVLADAEANQRALATLLGAGTVSPVSLSVGGASTAAYAWSVEPKTMLQFLREYRWQKDKAPAQRDIEFLLGAHLNPGIAKWTVIAPQLKDPDPDRMLTVGKTKLAIKHRHRDQTHGRYGVYSEPEHVALAEYIAGTDRAGTANSELRDLTTDDTAVMLLYAVQDYEHETSLVTVGFALQYPPNTEPTALLWKVKEPTSEADTA